MTVAADANALLERITPIKLGQLHPKLHEWYEPDALRKNVWNALEEEAKYATSREFTVGYASSAPVVGATPEMYANRLVDLPHLGPSLCMIRYFGMNLARPFVNIAFSNHLPSSNDDLLEATHALGREFEVFKPLHVRAYVPSHVRLELGRGAHWEKRLLAAPIRRLLERPEPANLSRVRLMPAENLDFYDQYTAAYTDLHTRNPQHAEYANPEDREDLEAYLNDGLLWTAHLDDAQTTDGWAGVVAAHREVLEGVRGFTVAEIVLNAKHRGQGLGAALNRRLIEALEPVAENDDALIGTIHARNAGAIKSALKVGREDLGGYVWIEVKS